VFQQLPRARDNRSQHFANLNHYRTQGQLADSMLGKFWQIDEDINNEFLEMLPPRYFAGGFRMIEKLTGDIAATFIPIGAHYWCGYVNGHQITDLAAHIRLECYK
jgi:hypothetical protein